MVLRTLLSYLTKITDNIYYSDIKESIKVA
jgi:hypothetical protein